ncbi:uncharacterized protein [Argopecten irradians]|uniref:uncharacterized protein n=1 Tax=Argopecten irradians TaxID=31199 RepID=UPI00371DFBF0
MEVMLVFALCLVCFLHVSMGQRFLRRNPDSRFDSRFDSRWRRPSSQGSAFDRQDWRSDPFTSTRSGLSWEDRQMLRAFERGSPSDRRSRHTGSGSSSWGRGGSQIDIEFDTRGRSNSRSHSRGFSRFSDSGFRGESRGFRSSGGSSRSNFDRFDSRPSSDIIMISSHSQAAERRRRTDQGRHFTDIGMQSASQPVVIRPLDQTLSRSEFIRSSRPAHDRLVNVDPINSSSHSSAPVDQWQEMNVPQLNTGIDSHTNSKPSTTTIISAPNSSTNTMPRSPDIFIQTSAHVNSAGSSAVSTQGANTSNVTNKGPTSTISNSILGGPAPGGSSLQSMLMSLVGSMDVNSHRFPRPTEEPLELEEILMRKLMARV